MGAQVAGSTGRNLVLVASGDATFDHGGVDNMVDLAMRYVADRRRRGELSKKTATDVRRMLFDFLRTTGATRQRCSTRQIEKWIYCRGAAAGTTRVRLSCVRKFFQWAVSNRHLKKDPTVGISRPKLPQSAPRKLTMPAATAVARSAPDARGRLIVLLMLQEGLRCVEVSRLELGDVDPWAATVAIRGKGGQGDVSRHTPLSAETVVALERYLSEHPASAGPLIRSYKRPQSGITPSTISCLVRRWMIDAGVKQRPRDGKSAHALRHTMASHLVERGEDVLTVQQALGHAHLSSTQVYLRGVTPDLRRAMGGRSYLDLPEAS